MANISICQPLVLFSYIFIRLVVGYNSNKDLFGVPIKQWTKVYRTPQSSVDLFFFLFLTSVNIKG